ncbi:MAG: phosphoribosylformylglycinamidine cyclo-ligase, partial [Acidimicrobiia bacterium]|nr:phosphoribosylformylglycinamidine cyclo-ligase [Acidimicrobiia bacterium]
LEPSVIYSPAAVAAARLDGVHGLVHVTGGGLPGNVPRVLPDGLGSAIDTSTWQSPEVFGWLGDAGGLSDDDLFGAFNMGIGYVAVADPGTAEEAIATFEDRGHPARVIGRVTDTVGFSLD